MPTAIAAAVPEARPSRALNISLWIVQALLGAMFLMAGAYTLSRNGHVRADVLYRFWQPRTQATMDLVLYIIFFLPAVAAFICRTTSSTLTWPEMNALFTTWVKVSRARPCRICRGMPKKNSLPSLVAARSRK